MRMTSIDVTGLTVFARHGVHPEESRLGQRFVLDLHVEADLAAAIAADDYAQAVCYGALCEMVVEIVSTERFRLIETLAAHVAEAALERFAPVSHVRVTVHKPAAPIALPTGNVSVTVTRDRMLPVAFALGSNQGESEAVLALAVNRLSTIEGVRIDAVSGLYRTAPQGVVDQPDFLNLCVVGRTSLAPLALLRAAKDIELELGRVAGRRWGPRVVDVDLLCLGERRWHDHVLTLPHPRLTERAFVLAPLAEIAPELRIAGRTVRDLLNDLSRSPGDVIALAAREAGAVREERE
ncbi:2-amino-4-hydroxy-6-hydroxymethyldihydropteridine diphosphokinase [Acidomonas methanolica]|uniref:2-amino-4-hydroxy-6- hydroxymethyldihydropteridine diphosphokinase n=1 Tax=Acidomonas methanolica TaxID=437 RepID=UPI002119C4E0|nr:2-amino-4-hydroxy-6-hydroxymethyldihydropteridine diphosphokinase [Acidomonas methanolica]MCQ9155146.1 2-amino-4-hydroxy-6-hydroxymethyldihydropteridine diphosphokinase [Acidomonas methanolica]